MFIHYNIFKEMRREARKPQFYIYLSVRCRLDSGYPWCAMCEKLS